MHCVVGSESQADVEGRQRTGSFVAQHGVDLGQHFAIGGRVGEERKEGPGEDCGGGLMARDEHGHEVIAQLLV